MPGSDDERLQRERDYHDGRWVDDRRAPAEKYYEAVASGPAAYRRLLAVDPDVQVLEYGCGTGSAAFDLAATGARVTAIDISPVGIEQGRAEASRRELSIDFREMNAEALEFPDASFDLVCGTGILHHLDLDRAAREVRRVLRPAGRAVFYEPMGHNPLINLYRKLTPAMRTPDEHPLLDTDLRQLASQFEAAETRFFGFFALAAAPFHRFPGGKALARALDKLDRILLEKVPFLRRYAWTVLLDLRRPALDRS